jgi:hypothetical protein
MNGGLSANCIMNSPGLCCTKRARENKSQEPRRLQAWLLAEWDAGSGYSDGQIHARMNGTIQFEAATGIEWPDRTAVVAVEGHVDARRAWFVHSNGAVSVPCAIFNDVLCR